MSPGASTWTVTSSIDTGHSSPIAFQYSSSWSANPFVAPSTVYTIVYRWSPETVSSGSPILIRVKDPSRSVV